KPVAITQITPAALNTTVAALNGTFVSLASVSGVNPGDTLNLGSESRKVTAVGTAAGAATTLFSPVAAGDTNVKVNSVTGYVVGQQAVIENELATVSAIGTAGTATTLSAAAAAGATNLKVASVTNLAVGDRLTVADGSVTITSVGTSGATGTG